MEPQASDIAKIAVYDPIAAYGMFLGIPRVPWSANCSGAFATLSIATPTPAIEADLDNTVAQRTWIDNISYTVQCPNIFPNQIFKPQFDWYLKLSPGVTVRLEVLGGPKYLVSPNFTPLENLVNVLDAARWPMGWPLYKQQTIACFLTLTQLPGGVPSPTGPYNVIITFNGWNFLDYTVDNLDPRTAAAELRKAGFAVPQISVP